MHNLRYANDTQTNSKRTLVFCIILETIMLLATTIVVVYVRELFESRNDYGLRLKYVWPEVDGPFDTGYAPPDDTLRFYGSPIHYSPLHWNCGIRNRGGGWNGWVETRLTQLCAESIAARDLTVLLLVVQALVLGMHGYALWEEGRNGNGGSEMRQGSGGNMEIAPGRE
jgi:hypothetical protein